MRAPKQPCPRCNSQQSFRPQRRDTEGQPGVIEVYIRCTMCNWENVLRKSTMQLEVLRTRERAWLAQATKEERRHHAVSGSTTRALNAVRAEMAKLRTQAGI